jgi:hypothetical protein
MFLQPSFSLGRASRRTLCHRTLRLTDRITTAFTFVMTQENTLQQHTFTPTPNLGKPRARPAVRRKRSGCGTCRYVVFSMAPISVLRFSSAQVLGCLQSRVEVVLLHLDYHECYRLRSVRLGNIYFLLLTITRTKPLWSNAY